jgi:CRP-like cAMP-binding protein
MSRGSDILERQSYSAGSMILREGDTGYSAYLVQSGRVHVFSSNDKHKVSLARLGPGEIFGEMALLSDEPRTASVEAVENCNLIVVTREVFKQKLGNSDPTVKAILKMLAGRVIESNNAVIHSINSIRDLEETIRIKFNNVLEQMPEEQKKNFRDSVLPEINDLLEALRGFREDSEPDASPKAPE